MMRAIIRIGSDDEVDNFEIKLGSELFFILGPCAIESEDHAFLMAEKISKICNKLGIHWIYKSCFDKDCRSSIDSYQGIGIGKGLEILSLIRKKFKIPVISDFSKPEDAKPTGKVCDIVQVPAYLCRQTSILKAAAMTKKPILLKKGQFMSPWNMRNSIQKIEFFGNKQIILAERGTFFGYNMLVTDMRSLPIMAETGYPVCFDATHSIQMPTSMGSISGGQREFMPNLVRSAVANGIDILFMEVHDNPDQALSDTNTVLDIKYLENILIQAMEIHKVKNSLQKKGFF